MVSETALTNQHTPHQSSEKTDGQILGANKYFAFHATRGLPKVLSSSALIILIFWFIQLRRVVQSFQTSQGHICVRPSSKWPLWWLMYICQSHNATINTSLAHRHNSHQLKYGQLLTSRRRYSFFFNNKQLSNSARFTVQTRMHATHVALVIAKLLQTKPDTSFTH